jgi:hypothetical protein
MRSEELEGLPGGSLFFFFLPGGSQMSKVRKMENSQEEQTHAEGM